MNHDKIEESEKKCYVSSEDEPNPIDLIAEELDTDRIHLDSLRLDKRMNAKDYEFITRLPLSAKQLINILYELYPPKLFQRNIVEPSVLTNE